MFDAKITIRERWYLSVMSSWIKLYETLSLQKGTWALMSSVNDCIISKRREQSQWAASASPDVHQAADERRVQGRLMAHFPSQACVMETWTIRSGGWCCLADIVITFFFRASTFSASARFVHVPAGTFGPNGEAMITFICCCECRLSLTNQSGNWCRNNIDAFTWVQTNFQ